ncbi:MAG: hypothetical protein LBK94_12570 [Prevotellaceae bacterium]|jgi:hypothetical protein|nr:hypothetical protein [Prevotellaceae bacterium]
MEKKSIRPLTADEIDCRVQSITKKGCVLLLYKDARCDMRILDETFGICGWQRRHEVINENLFCTVSIWDENKNAWVDKQDVGVESNTEKQKGEASDSFKRACFNVGIGRELYTAPFVYILLSDTEMEEYNGKIKLKVSVKFKVSAIEYNEAKEIVKLKIIDNKGTVRFEYSNGKLKTVEAKTIEAKPKNADNWDILIPDCNKIGLLEIVKNNPELKNNKDFQKACNKRKLELIENAQW